MELSELKEGVITTIRDTDWYPYFRYFLGSEELEKPLQTVLEHHSLGFRITPQMKYLFRCFYETPKESVKIVFHTEQVANDVNGYDGLCYSRSAKKMLDHHTSHFLRINRLKGIYRLKGDLTPWAKQGVLLSTAAMTNIIREQNSHFQQWVPFWNRVFEVFKTELPADIIYVLIGKEVWFRKKQLCPESLVICLPDLNSVHKKDKLSLLPYLNEELVKRGKKEIIWHAAEPKDLSTQTTN